MSYELSAEDKKLLNQYSYDWAQAKARGDAEGMAAAHDSAEAVRAKYGYSGGDDGSQQIALTTTSSTGTTSTQSSNTGTTVPTAGGGGSGPDLISGSSSSTTTDSDLDLIKPTVNSYSGYSNTTPTRTTSTTSSNTTSTGSNYVAPTTTTNKVTTSTTPTNTVTSDTTVREPGYEEKVAIADVPPTELTAEDQARLRALSQAYADAKASGDMEGAKQAHEMAERIRAKYGFSGGVDGSGYEAVDPNKYNDGKSYVDTEGNSFSDLHIKQIQDYGTNWATDNYLYQATGDESYLTSRDSQAEAAQGVRAIYGVQADASGQGTYALNEVQDVDTLQEVADNAAELDTNVGGTDDGINDYVRARFGDSAEYRDGGLYDSNGELFATVTIGDDGTVVIENIVTTQAGSTNEIVDVLNSMKETNDGLLEQMQDIADSLGQELDLSTVLSWDEAKARAEEMIGGLYDNERENYRKELDRDALKRGMLNQLPGEAYTRGKLEEFENQRSSDIAQLASELRGQSVNEAQNLANMKQQATQSKLSVLLAALDASNLNAEMMVNTLTTLLNIDMSKKQNEAAQENSDFEKRLAYAQLTGYWINPDGSSTPTLAMTSFLTDLGFKESEFAQKLKESEASIAQGWSRIANDRASIENAKARLGLEERAMDLNEQQFHLSIFDMAMEKTIEEIGLELPGFDVDHYDDLLQNDKVANDAKFNNASRVYDDADNFLGYGSAIFEDGEKVGATGIELSNSAYKYVTEYFETHADAAKNINFESRLFENMDMFTSQIIGD